MAELTCGNCGKGVAGSDVTCPHCGVLLAAYASPSGSVSSAPDYTAPDYATPPKPVSAESVPEAPPVTIAQPEVPEWARPPEKAGVASSAPQPLFDTHLTVDELAKSADSGSTADLITIGGTSVLRDPAVPEVSADEPLPPVEPIPTPEPGDDASPRLKQFDVDAPAAPSWTVPEYARQAEKPAVPVEDDDSEPPAPPAPAPTPRASSRRKSKPEPTVEPIPETDVLLDTNKLDQFAEGTVGQTEAYLRKLHQQAGYNPPGNGPLTKPLPQQRPSVLQRRRNREKNEQARQAARSQGKQGRQPTYMMPLILGFFTFVIWMNFLGSIATGDFSPALLFWGVIMSFMVRATWMRASNWNKHA